MYNLIEYSDNYLKMSGILWQYYRDEPSLAVDNAIQEFTCANNSKLFKFKRNVTGITGNYGPKDFEIMVSLKYLSNFWITFKMPLINCEVKLMLSWYKKCVKASNTAANQKIKFAITDTNIYVSVVTLSTQDNANLLQQLKSGFKRTINWNKYLSKISTQAI